jgi:hypothetical protein
VLSYSDPQLTMSMKPLLIACVIPFDSTSNEHSSYLSFLTTFISFIFSLLSLLTHSLTHLFIHSFTHATSFTHSHIRSLNEETTSHARMYSRKYLPDYMRPDHYIYFTSFPTNHNGKVLISPLLLCTQLTISYSVLFVTRLNG